MKYNGVSRVGFFGHAGRPAGAIRSAEFSQLVVEVGVWCCGSTTSGLPFTSRSRMNRLFDKNSKKSLKPHISLGILPINVAAGPLGFRAGLDIGPKGEQGRTYHGLEETDGPDSTVVPDGNDTGPSRIVIQEDESEDQRTPAPEALTPNAVDGCAEDGNDNTSEHFRSLPSRAVFIRVPVFLSGENAGDAGKEEGKPADTSRGTCLCQRIVRFLLTPTSPGKGPQRHGVWGCHRSR